MNNKIKGLVSKKKNRYQKDGFDLDLTYITDRIIAMGFPAQSFEGIYRNHIDDVVRFFNLKHDKHFRIYNLCNERYIDQEKFGEEVINHEFPFNDHNPPEFSQMINCCQDIKNYLKSNKSNVVAVQCKAGKGRTGVIVCACLVDQEPNKNATTCLIDYGNKRTSNGKGVTIPSQIRYVYYYEYYLRQKLKYNPIKLTLEYMELQDFLPVISNGNELLVKMYGYNHEKRGRLKELYTSDMIELKREQRSVKINFYVDLKGDIKFQLIVKYKYGIKENLCHCWLNTFFVVNAPPVTSVVEDKNSNNRKVHSAKQSEENMYDQFNTSENYAETDDKNSSEKQTTRKPTKRLNVTSTNNPFSATKYKVTLKKHEIDKANKDVNNKTFSKFFSIAFSFAQSINETNNPKSQVENFSNLNAGTSFVDENIDNSSVSSESSSETL